MTKPLKQKAYGSIPHLPGSKTGPGDYTIGPGQARILTEVARKGDTVYVQEKLDGSNVAVAKIGGEIVPLIRAGYRAANSPRTQHKMFHLWAMHHARRFDELLREGERACGEWLYMAHGTRYALPHEPFVLFDLMTGMKRERQEDVWGRATIQGFVTPILLSAKPIHPTDFEEAWDVSYHSNRITPAEGLVYRVENDVTGVDFLAKWVRHDFVPGLYFQPDGSEITNAFPRSDVELLTALGHNLGLRLELECSSP